MGFTEFSRSIQTDGLMAMLFRQSFRMRLMNWDDIGAIAERLKYNARLDGLKINMDNPLFLTEFKGRLIMGQYEEYERQIIKKYLPKHEPVIELGGSIGVVSCLINRELTSPEWHVVVEANPTLIPTLQKNRELNACHFTIVDAAIGYDGPSIAFFSNGFSLVGNVFQGGDVPVQVPTITLQAIAENAGFDRFNVVSDIEGSEIDLVQHEMDFLRAHVNLLLVETHEETPHGEEGPRIVASAMQQNNFEIIENIGFHYCFRNKEWQS